MKTWWNLFHPPQLPSPVGLGSKSVLATTWSSLYWCREENSIGTAWRFRDLARASGKGDAARDASAARLPRKRALRPASEYPNANALLCSDANATAHRAWQRAMASAAVAASEDALGAEHAHPRTSPGRKRRRGAAAARAMAAAPAAACYVPPGDCAPGSDADIRMGVRRRGRGRPCEARGGSARPESKPQNPKSGTTGGAASRTTHAAKRGIAATTLCNRLVEQPVPAAGPAVDVPTAPPFLYPPLLNNMVLDCCSGD
eukprot:359108-Chlamydomonas_euryale.AAC.15